MPAGSGRGSRRRRRRAPGERELARQHGRGSSARSAPVTLDDVGGRRRRRRGRARRSCAMWSSTADSSRAIGSTSSSLERQAREPRDVQNLVAIDHSAAHSMESCRVRRPTVAGAARASAGGYSDGPFVAQRLPRAEQDRDGAGEREPRAVQAASRGRGARAPARPRRSRAISPSSTHHTATRPAARCCAR